MGNFVMCLLRMLKVPSDQPPSPAGVCSVAFQVANAKVLIPTTGLVPAEVINAAMDLRLIVNPAAGITPTVF